jgi:cell division septum initiation protein DivIVA
MHQSERNASGLLEAAERRSAWARERVRKAIGRLERDGKPITFQSVAREAGVSRQFLYAVDALRGEIERLRSAQSDTVAAQLPSVQRASDASLKARNQMLLDENRRLRQELAGMREELAGAWGELRALQRERRRTGPLKAES